MKPIYVKLKYEENQGMKKGHHAYHNMKAELIISKPFNWSDVKLGTTLLKWRTSLLEYVHDAVPVPRFIPPEAANAPHPKVKLLLMNTDAKKDHQDFLKELYEGYNPDLMAICEIPYAVGRQFASQYDDIDFVCGQLLYYGDAILLCAKRTKYQILHDTFQVSGVGKYVSVQMIDLHNNEVFLWISVHLPHEKRPLVYQKSVESIRAHIQETNLPYMVTGDFNRQWRQIEHDFEIASLIKKQTTRAKRKYGIDNVLFALKTPVRAKYETVETFPYDTHKPIKIEFS